MTSTFESIFSSSSLSLFPNNNNTNHEERFAAVEETIKVEAEEQSDFLVNVEQLLECNLEEREEVLIPVQKPKKRQYRKPPKLPITVKIFRCDVESGCNRAYGRKSDLIRHKKEKHGVFDRKRFWCMYPNCGKRFSSNTYLERHKVLLHNFKPNSTSDTSQAEVTTNQPIIEEQQSLKPKVLKATPVGIPLPTPSPPKFKEKAQDKKKKMKKEEKKKTKKEKKKKKKKDKIVRATIPIMKSVYRCLYCNEFESTAKLSLRAHVLDQHYGEERRENRHQFFRYQCRARRCMKRFLLKGDLKQHHLSEHEKGMNSIRESLLNSSFAQQDEIEPEIHELLDDILYRVQKNVTDSATKAKHPCLYPGCSATFRTLKARQGHEMTHPVPGGLPCDLCDYRAKFQLHLLQHRRSAHFQMLEPEPLFIINNNNNIDTNNEEGSKIDLKIYKPKKKKAENKAPKVQKPPKPPRPPGRPTKRPFLCSKCKFRSKTLHWLDLHFKRFHSELEPKPKGELEEVKNENLFQEQECELIS